VKGLCCSNFIPSVGFHSLQQSLWVVVHAPTTPPSQWLRGDGAAAEAKVSEPGSSTLQEVRLVWEGVLLLIYKATPVGNAMV